jgi:CRISPR-associated protein Csm5
VALTLLSPIHIGCGEDFEPTNYLIDAEQKLLYGFDPSRAALSEAFAKKLAELGEK